MKTENIYLIISITMMILMASVCLYILNSYQDRCAMRNAFNQTEYKTGAINGIYYPSKKFYCVWVEDRFLPAIEQTDRHEYCHWLVDVQGEHFCEDYIDD